MKNRWFVFVGCGLLSALLTAHAQSVFVGTWRPDPQRPDPKQPPQVIELTNGQYACRSCSPPYTIKADGTDQPVEGNPRFDTMGVLATSARSVLRTAKRHGLTVDESTTTLSADGQTKTEVRTVTGFGTHPVEMAIHSQRIAAAPKDAHALSGEWRVVEADLVHHDEDTSYTLDGDELSMKDKLGRSFTAKLDGSDAPYTGDPRFDTVSLELVDPHTLRETDKHGTETVLVALWSVDTDGTTMHVTFDDTHGSVQHQTGHKLP